MSKIFVCRECGYVFPQELSYLIESNIQVYCERCGSPFILEGVKFKPAPTPYIREKKPYHILPEKKSSGLEKFIQVLNKISSIPFFIYFFFLIVTIPILEFIPGNLIDHIFQIIITLFLITYDRTHITRKVREKKYNEIFLDSFCWGILGCIMYGLGVIILIKGIFIIIYILTNSQNKNLKIYDFGLLAKNSLNYFSNKAGFIIILYSIYLTFIRGIHFPNGGNVLINLVFGITIPLGVLIYIALLIFALIILFIDTGTKKQLNAKQKFVSGDAVKYMVLGILGTVFYAAGIFILLKGILIIFLCFGKPSKEIQITSEIEKPVIYAPSPPIPPVPPTPPTPPRKEIEIKPSEKPIKIQAPVTSKKEDIKIEAEIIEKAPTREVEEISDKIDEEEKTKREEEFKLRLHDSLLPVKDEKDKKLVKAYFSRIFAVLSKDLRKQIVDLKISKKEKKELLEELAFLTQEEQVKYIEAIIGLYKEIPKKLINRIRKLPNVKPEHYDKIVEELKHMDYDEQMKFVQFLEENA